MYSNDFMCSVDYLLSPSAAFNHVVGSEFVQKYLGEGPCMVRNVFQLSHENVPSIIFIDEIDAIATKRLDIQTGGMSMCILQQMFVCPSCYVSLQ